ncbi:MAG: hypothetical protein IKY73_07425 [Bacteroidaceae bacterium]|nr:hypothetical protein [Bacteroidaceae bacterium]
MENQISDVITILSTLLTGGILIILIETLHLNNVIADRFYNKIKPFESRLISYINFVKLMESSISYEKDESGYTDTLKGLIHKIATIDNNKPIYHSFTACTLDDLCEKTINGVWYYLSEKSQYVMPYICLHNDYLIRSEDIKEQLYNISPKYKQYEPSLETLMNVSGDFYINIYRPINNAFFEYEYCQKIMKRANIVSTIYITAITFCLLFVLLFGITINIYVSYILVVCFSLCFLCLIYKFIKIYKDSIDRLK